MSRRDDDYDKKYLNQKKLYRQRKKKRISACELKDRLKLFVLTLVIMVIVIIVAMILMNYFEGVLGEVNINA